MGKNEKLPFVLASASPRRRRLMKTMPFAFRVMVSRREEPRAPSRVRPGRWALEMARFKAWDVARRVKRGMVLGADTLVYQKGEILGKPANEADARRMLGKLAGRWHAVYTGLCLVARPANREWNVLWRTGVKMRALAPEKILYWSKRNHDKAGAYAAQYKRNPFVGKYRGDFDNVVGLPRKGVRLLLRRALRNTRYEIRKRGRTTNTKAVQ